MIIKMKHFLTPLRERKIIPLLEISQLFANVEIILEYCKEMYKSLEEHIKIHQGYSAVGEIFLAQVDNMIPAYSNYCSNAQTSSTILDRLTKRKKFSRFLMARSFSLSLLHHHHHHHHHHIL